MVGVFIPWKSANAKCHNLGIFFPLRKWFIRTPLLARENHSDFTKTSGLSDQAGHLSGFRAANNKSQPWKAEMAFLGRLSGGLQNPQEMWRRGIRKRAGAEDSEAATMQLTLPSPRCHWALDLDPGCIPLCQKEFSMACFLASLLQLGMATFGGLTLSHIAATPSGRGHEEQFPGLSCCCGRRWGADTQADFPDR